MYRGDAGAPSPSAEMQEMSDLMRNKFLLPGMSPPPPSSPRRGGEAKSL